MLSVDQAIALLPASAPLHCLRGLALQDLLQLESALVNFDNALRIDPDCAQAKLGKANVLLLSGNFQDGWPLFEWREWRDAKVSKGLAGRDFFQPRWQGFEPLVNKTILIYSDEGVGDTIQFVRYVRLLLTRGARVILQVPQALIILLQPLRAIVHVISLQSPLPNFDYHCPLLSLPLAFETTLDTIPSGKSYLKPIPQHLESWRQRLGQKTQPRIGLACNADFCKAGFVLDRQQPPPLGPLLMAGYTYYDLQPEKAGTGNSLLDAHPQVTQFSNELTDLADTAALASLMDLVITFDSGLAHLCGALGIQTWLILPYCPDWRWLLHRTDSPWYPSLRLYRDANHRGLANVVLRIADDLEHQYEALALASQI